VAAVDAMVTLLSLLDAAALNRMGAHPSLSAVASARNTYNTMATVSQIGLVVWLVAMVPLVGWLHHRRPAQRRRLGEEYVEPKLRRLFPTLNVALWSAAGLSWLSALIFASMTRPGDTIRHLMERRLVHTGGGVARTAAFVILVLMVRRSEAHQVQRESLPVTPVGARPVTGVSQGFGYATLPMPTSGSAAQMVAPVGLLDVRFDWLLRVGTMVVGSLLGGVLTLAGIAVLLNGNSPRPVAAIITGIGAGLLCAGVRAARAHQRARRDESG